MMMIVMVMMRIDLDHRHYTWWLQVNSPGNASSSDLSL